MKRDDEPGDRREADGKRQRVNARERDGRGRLRDNVIHCREASEYAVTDLARGDLRIKAVDESLQPSQPLRWKRSNSTSVIGSAVTSQVVPTVQSCLSARSQPETYLCDG